MATIDMDKLSQYVRNKRGKRNQREIAYEIGDVSTSTISRIEQGKIPDLTTYFRICEWLGVPADEFNLKGTEEEKDHKKEIFYHLKADQTLKPDVADALTKMIEFAYQNAETLIKNKDK